MAARIGHRLAGVPEIAAVFVGKPRRLPRPEFASPGQYWLTTFIKNEVAEPVWLGREGIEGNRVADPRVHGGPQQAALFYSADHYPYWRLELGIEEMGPGGFGENFSVRGQNEQDVCVGDRYRCGEALVEVSQPRGPCYKISWRWNRPELLALVEENLRHGWYVRVLEEGAVGLGDALELLDRPHPEWSVARVSQTMRDRKHERAAAAQLAAVPALSPEWRRRLWQAATRS